MDPAPKKLVLIADDYDDAAALLADFLEWTTPYEATYAKDGLEALERARERIPDVAILDIDMPRIGGLEAARRMREEFGEKRPFLIAISGRLERSELDILDQFDLALRKPLDVDDLIQLLARH
jgi:CheY-like chemotaxis protein